MEEQAASRRARLSMLAAMDADQGDAGVLLNALLHLAVELGALGGMAHLPIAGSRYPGIRLVASCGLPGAFTLGWETIAHSGSAAPSRVLREGTGFTWLPTLDAPEQLPDRPPLTWESCGLPAGSGIAAVALPGPGGPLGALSLITPPSGEPGPQEREFLAEVAKWAGGRLRLSVPRPEGLSPALMGPTGEPELLGARGKAGGGAWEWDLDSGALSVDTAFTTKLGIDWPGGGLVESFADLVHPDDQPYVVHGAEESILSHGPYDAEFRTLSADGAYVWVRALAQVESDAEGRAVRLTGMLHDTTEAHAALEPVGRALRHMTDGFLSVGRDWRIEFVNVAASRLLGSSSSLSGRLLWDLPAIREVPRLEERCRRAVLTGTPTNFDVSWPDNDQWYHLRLVPVPGGLTLYCTDITERRLREAERAQAERAAADRAAITGALTLSLAEALTAHDVVTAVAARMLPHFTADGLLVATVDDERLRVVGSKGYSLAFLDHFHGLPLTGTSPITEALLHRCASFIESEEEYSDRYPEEAAFAAHTGRKVGAFLPLVASGGMGVCIVSYAGSHAFSPEERTLLEELSGLIAQALERASLYDESAARARELQRALLPRELPLVAAVTATARYLPAEQGAQVGGDWYDLIPLSADRVALVVGDVMGHGMAEAAKMGQLRTAVRTLSDLELPPDEILSRLNDIVADLGDYSLATCLYGVFDPVDHDFTYASAGHPSPAIVAPDGAVTFPLTTPNPPLGAAVPPFETMTSTLPDGSLVVLYTDGLVEAATQDIDIGMAHLARTLTTAVHDGHADNPEHLCDAVLSALSLAGPDPRNDDAILLIARAHHLAPDAVASWPLPEDPRAAGQARDVVREQLSAWALDDLVMTTELIVSELVANAIRHATGPISLRLLHSRSLICEVSDASLTTPHIRHSSATDEGGRGLQLVAAMTRRWGTRYTSHGKSIWAEQPLAT